MSERLSPTAESFVKEYSRAFPPTVKLQIAPSTKITAESSRSFRTSRRKLIADYLQNQPNYESYAQSLLAEQLVVFSLEPLLEECGFSTHLAPQSLERGDLGYKGVDILITDPQKLVYLGMDVKLRVGRSLQQRDGHTWDTRLLSPFIFLSLGNWTVKTRERENVLVRDWVNHYAIPRINGTGKIPRIDEFRRYLVARIEKSLHWYQERVTEPCYADYSLSDIPRTSQEMEILEQKLAVMSALFSDLRTFV